MNYHLNALGADSVEKVMESSKKVLGSMTSLSVPEGKTVEEMTKATGTATTEAPASSILETKGTVVSADTSAKREIQWKKPDQFIRAIRETVKENARAYQARKRLWYRGGSEPHSTRVEGSERSRKFKMAQPPQDSVSHQDRSPPS
jgi:hypothetical protein